MNKYIEKQRQFYDLADSYYSETMNDFMILDMYSDDIDEKEFRFYKMRLATKMGLACEYYLKGMLFPLLDVKSPDENNRELIDIINSLGEEDKYKICVGECGEIINRLSMDYGKKKNELKFLNTNTLKTNQHNIIDLVNQVVNNARSVCDKILDSKNNNMDEESLNKLLAIDKIRNLKTSIFSFVRMYSTLPGYISPFCKHRLNYDWLVNWDAVKEDDLIRSKYLFEDPVLEVFSEKANINNSFVKARYAHLDDDYDLDCFLLSKIMDIIKDASSYNSVFLETNILDKKSGFLKRIYPDINSKIYIISGKDVVRSYKVESKVDFVNHLINDNIANLSKEDIAKIKKTHHLDLKENVCVAEYGVPFNDNEIIDETIFYSILGDSYDPPITINENERVCFYEEGVLKSYVLYYDSNVLIKNNKLITERCGEIINSFDESLNSNEKYLSDKKYLNKIFCYNGKEKSNIIDNRHKVLFKVKFD